MINKKRVLRTLIQSASGAGIALITAVASDYNSTEAIITSIITFVSTVAIAVLMNIEKQAKENDNDE